MVTGIIDLRNIALDLLVHQVEEYPPFRGKSKEEIKEQLPKFVNLYKEFKGETEYSVSFGALSILVVDRSTIQGRLKFRFIPKKRVLLEYSGGYGYGALEHRVVNDNDRHYGYIIYGNVKVDVSASKRSDNQ